MTQTQTEFESEIRRMQSEGIDVSAVLSRREIQFLNGQFEPNMNYARQLRFTIRQKVTKALGNPNGNEPKRYKIVTGQGINPSNTNNFMHVLHGTQPCNSGHPVESAGGGKASSHL